MLHAQNLGPNWSDERKDTVCKKMSSRISNDIILNHQAKVSPNKPHFQYAQPLKPHPGVSQQNVNLVTALEMFHGKAHGYEALCSSQPRQYHLSVSAAWQSRRRGEVRWKEKEGREEDYELSCGCWIISLQLRDTLCKLQVVIWKITKERRPKMHPLAEEGVWSSSEGNQADPGTHKYKFTSIKV